MSETGEVAFTPQEATLVVHEGLLPAEGVSGLFQNFNEIADQAIPREGEPMGLFSNLWADGARFKGLTAEQRQLISERRSRLEGAIKAGAQFRRDEWPRADLKVGEGNEAEWTWVRPDRQELSGKTPAHEFIFLCDEVAAQSQDRGLAERASKLGADLRKHFEVNIGGRGMTYKEYEDQLAQRAAELAKQDGIDFGQLGQEEEEAQQALGQGRRMYYLLKAEQAFDPDATLVCAPSETPTGEPGEQVEAGEEEKRTEQIMGDIASLFGIREDRMTEFFDLLGVSSSKFEQGKMTEEEFDEFTNKIKKMQEEGFNPNDVRTRIKLKIAADRLSEAFGLPSGISLSELQDKILEDCGITPEQIKTKSAGWLKGVWEKLKDWKKEKGKKERTNPLFWIFMLVMGLTNAIKETTPSPQAAQ